MIQLAVLVEPIVVQRGGGGYLEANEFKQAARFELTAVSL